MAAPSRTQSNRFIAGRNSPLGPIASHRTPGELLAGHPFLEALRSPAPSQQPLACWTEMSRLQVNVKAVWWYRVALLKDAQEYRPSSKEGEGGHLFLGRPTLHLQWLNALLQAEWCSWGLCVLECV